MAKAFYIGVDGKARLAKKIYIGVDGKAHKVKKVYAGVDGKARLAYQSYIPVTGIKLTWRIGGFDGEKHNGEKYVWQKPTKFTATITPENATDKTLKWCLSGNCTGTKIPLLRHRKRCMVHHCFYGFPPILCPAVQCLL